MRRRASHEGDRASTIVRVGTISTCRFGSEGILAKDALAPRFILDRTYAGHHLHPRAPAIVEMAPRLDTVSTEQVAHLKAKSEMVLRGPTGTLARVLIAHPSQDVVRQPPSQNEDGPLLRVRRQSSAPPTHGHVPEPTAVTLPHPPGSGAACVHGTPRFPPGTIILRSPRLQGRLAGVAHRSAQP